MRRRRSGGMWRGAGNRPTLAITARERRGVSFARVLADGGIGPKLTHVQRFDGDPDPIDVDFRFDRFDGVTPEAYASDHCPVFFEIA
jgi:hypothetical protein